MLHVTSKGLLAHKLRLATTAIAVLLGVAFMAGTLVLTDTIGTTFDGLFADINAGTDVVVRGAQSVNSRVRRRAGRSRRSVLATVQACRRRARRRGQRQRLRPVRRQGRQGRRQPEPGRPHPRLRAGPTTRR